MNAVILGSNININDTQLIDCRKITDYLLIKGFNIYTDGRTGFSETANKFAFKNNFEKSYVIKLIEEEGNGYYNSNNISEYKYNYQKKKKIISKDFFVIFPGDYETISYFFDIILSMENDEEISRPIILYGFKFWNSLKTFFDYNNIYFPDHYVLDIINSYNEFEELLNKYFMGKKLNLISVNEDIENFESNVSTRKNNIFMSNDKNLLSNYNNFRKSNIKNTNESNNIKIYVNSKEKTSSNEDSIEVIDYESSEN